VAPSLSLHDNEIVWSVKVRVQVPGTRDDTGTFVVTIRPALAPDRSSRRDGSGYGGTGYAGPGESR
jgi:hypothetical protein